jgi:hypothetical protein
MKNLYKYDDASVIREATEEEVERSDRAARLDGGVGAITVEIDGENVTCYVE